MGGITDTLIHPTFAGGNDDAGLRTKAIESHNDLCSITAADGISNDVGVVASISQIEGCLGNADMGLDAN